MIHFNLDPEAVNKWLLNFVLVAFFLLELTLIGYILYLIVHRIPKLGGTMEPGRRVRNADRFRNDREALASENVELPEPVPEPEDIDRVSREHNERWREHFRDADEK
jgi:hypothetical protein